MLLVVFGACAFVLLFAQMIVFAQLSQHRTDIRRGESPGAGASPFWQVNVMRRANYTEAGQSLLRRFKILQVAWLLSLVGVLSQLWRR